MSMSLALESFFFLDDALTVLCLPRSILSTRLKLDMYRGSNCHIQGQQYSLSWCASLTKLK